MKWVSWSPKYPAIQFPSTEYLNTICEGKICEGKTPSVKEKSSQNSKKKVVENDGDTSYRKEEEMLEGDSLSSSVPDSAPSAKYHQHTEL